MRHKWFVTFHNDEQECARCGLVETEHERNLSASQSTELYSTYWLDGVSFGRTDPGCVEKD